MPYRLQFHYKGGKGSDLIYSQVCYLDNYTILRILYSPQGILRQNDKSCHCPSNYRPDCISVLFLPFYWECADVNSIAYLLIVAQKNSAHITDEAFSKMNQGVMGILFFLFFLTSNHR